MSSSRSASRDGNFSRRNVGYCARSPAVEHTQPGTELPLGRALRGLLRRELPSWRRARRGFALAAAAGTTSRAVSRTRARFVAVVRDSSGWAGLGSLTFPAHRALRASGWRLTPFPLRRYGLGNGFITCERQPEDAARRG